MKITNEYLDKLIIDNTKESGEIFSLYIDFENKNINFDNIADTNGVDNKQLAEYKEVVNYYFTLISNTSDFFSEVENESEQEVINFKSIKFMFLDNKIEIEVETPTAKTKEILNDYFEKYYEEFAPEEYVEIYNIEVLEG